MKKILLFIVFLLSLYWFTFSCSKNNVSHATLLADAEMAYSQGHYDNAQLIADSITAAGVLERMNVDMLCRLSLLYMHLGERFDEEANIANAAKTLDAKGRYSNFEMYLHYLVRDIVKKQSESGVYMPLK